MSLICDQLTNCFHQAFEYDLRDEKFGDILDESYLKSYICESYENAILSTNKIEKNEIPSPIAWKIVHKFVASQLNITSEEDEQLASKRLIDAIAEFKNLRHKYNNSNWLGKILMRFTTNINDFYKIEKDYVETYNRWYYAYSLSKLAVSIYDRYHIDRIDSIELESAKLFAIHLFEHAWSKSSQTLPLNDFASHIYSNNAEAIRSCHQHETVH